MSDPRPCPARGVACTWAITARAYSRSSRRQTSPLLLGDCNVRCKTHFAPKLLGGKRAHSVALYTTKASYLGVPAPVRLGQTTSVVLAYQEFHVKRRRGETQSPLGSCTLGGTAETRVGALMKRSLAAQISAKHSSTRSSLDTHFQTLPTGKARAAPRLPAIRNRYAYDGVCRNPPLLRGQGAAKPQDAGKGSQV